MRRLVATVISAILLVGATGCGIGSDRYVSGASICEGKTSYVVSKYRIMDTNPDDGDRGNMYMITASCKLPEIKGYTWYVSWPESAGDASKNVGPSEWEKAEVGDEIAP